MKCFYYFLFAILFNLSLFAQESLNSDSLISDFEYFTRLLETTHPDPYSGFGGKVFFHEKAYNIKNTLKKQPCNIQEFWNLSMAFLSNIQDSHTYLNDINSPKENQKFLPIKLKPTTDRLVVQELPIQYENLLGSTLIEINGKCFSELLSLTAQHYACENLYDQYYKLSRSIPDAEFIKQLFPNTKDSVCFNLLTVDKKSVSLKLPFMSLSKGTLDVESATLPNSNVFPKEQLAYDFIDDKAQIMFVKINSINAKDNFEFMYQNGWNFYSQLSYYYKGVLQKDIPNDTIKAIQGLSSFSEVFSELLNKMKENQSSTLIIDLRGNGGGWTPITLPTLYQLFGDKYLEADLQTKYYRLISPLYLQKINMSLENFNKQYLMNYRLGDYTFDGDTDYSSDSIIEKRNSFISNCMSSDKEELKKMNGVPIYTPKNIFVLMNDETFSAAFHYAFFLWRMGATVVGIPCRQAPNTYMEQTPFELLYTRLKGSISNSIQIFLPGKDKRAKIFYPDVVLSYEDYKKYNFDKQSEIMFLLDYIKGLH